MATVVMEILFVVGGFKMDRGAELTLVNANIYVQKCYMVLGNVPAKVDGIVTVEPFRECNEVRIMWPESCSR